MPSIVILSTITPESAVTVPAIVTSAPLNVAAVVVPDLIIRLPEEFVSDPYVAASSFSITSPPSAFKTISPATSTVRSPEDKSISVPSMVMLSTTTPAFDVKTPPVSTVPAKVAFAPAKVSAVVGVVPDFITSSPVEFVNDPYVAVSSARTTSPPSVFSVIVPATSKVRLPEATSYSLLFIVVFALDPALTVLTYMLSNLRAFVPKSKLVSPDLGFISVELNSNCWSGPVCKIGPPSPAVPS